MLHGMSFGLKNAGAMYQRAIPALFHDMIHKMMEAYIGDIIAKSKAEEDHLTDLQKIFERLRKYDLKLNSNKCLFGATSGKLFGFIVSQLSSKINPSKIKAIIGMLAPRK